MQMFEKQSTKRSQNEFNCKKGKSAESGYRFGFWFWAGGLYFFPFFSVNGNLVLANTFFTLCVSDN